MRLYADRAAEAMLANQQMPQAKVNDPDDLEAVSTAITLRAARPGADRVDETFVAMLRRRLATEFADVPAAPKLPRRTLLVAASVAVAGLTATVAGRSVVAPERQMPAGGPTADLVPDGGHWPPVIAESELTDGSVHPFTSPSAVGFVVEHAGAVSAVSGICTHRGCLLQLDRAARRLNCPCHRAVFSFDGTLVSSEIRPAPERLPPMEGRRRAGQSGLLFVGA